MIYLLHGKDRYRIRRRLLEIRGSLNLEDTLDGNVSLLEGATLSPGELLAHASAAPFLAESRLIVVDSLIASLSAERKGRSKKKDDDPLGPWLPVAPSLADPNIVPPTTTVVFVEGPVDQRTQPFKLLAGLAKTHEFKLLDRREDSAELAEWIQRIAGEQGASLGGRTTAMIAQLSGGDLWAIEMELAKLSAYADGAVVEPEMLSAVSRFTQDTKVWTLTDAIVAGDERQALSAMQRLIGEGEAPQLLLFMVVRQFRQLVVTKDMRERGVPANQIEAATGIPSFRVARVGDIASRYSWPLLHECYQLLIDADLAVKRGENDIEGALQLVVHYLCARAPQAGVHTASRR